MLLCAPDRPDSECKGAGGASHEAERIKVQGPGPLLLHVLRTHADAVMTTAADLVLFAYDGMQYCCYMRCLSFRRCSHSHLLGSLSGDHASASPAEGVVVSRSSWLRVHD